MTNGECSTVEEYQCTPPEQRATKAGPKNEPEKNNGKGQLALPNTSLAT